MDDLHSDSHPMRRDGVVLGRFLHVVELPKYNKALIFFYWNIGVGRVAGATP